MDTPAMSDHDKPDPSPLPQEPFRLPRLPRPGKPKQERRKSRSGHAGQALELALDAARRQGALDVVMVTDDFGRVVSNSPTHLDLEELAAVAPIVARNRARARIRRGGQEREFSVRTMRIWGETLHIAALGGHSSTRERQVSKSVAATARILA